MLPGALQERLIAVVPLAIAVRPVGAPGTVVVVVALATLEGRPVPLALIAETRKWRVVPGAKRGPLWKYNVKVLLVLATWSVQVEPPSEEISIR